MPGPRASKSTTASKRRSSNRQQAAKVAFAPVVPSAGYDLHDHRLGHGDPSVVAISSSASSTALPVARSNSTHADVSTRITARGARRPASPDRPGAAHASASSRVIGWPARCRSARSTASVFVARPPWVVQAPSWGDHRLRRTTRTGAVVTRNAASTSLAEVLDGWAPGAVHSSRRVDPWCQTAIAALLDAPPPPLEPGDPLPPMWHWFTLLEHPAHAELGADGHPAAGHFLPPDPAPAPDVRRRPLPPAPADPDRRRAGLPIHRGRTWRSSTDAPVSWPSSPSATSSAWPASRSASRSRTSSTAPKRTARLGPDVGRPGPPAIEPTPGPTGGSRCPPTRCGCSGSAR